MHAPIAIFAYRRPQHLAATLDSLERCPEFSSSPVRIYSDGPKNAAAEDDVRAVRAMLRERIRPNMELFEAAENRGLAKSIIRGVTDLCNEFGRVIVIEDDLILSPHSLTWFNSALETFQEEGRVFQISAHQFDVPSFRSREVGMFLPLTTSWGWATWKRAWEAFDAEAAEWSNLSRDSEIRFAFDLDGSYPYSAMLEQQMAGTVDSWAIRWWWSVFRKGGYTLFPPRSLVANSGFDDRSTHHRASLFRDLFRRRERLDAAYEPIVPSAFSIDEREMHAVRRVIGRKNRLLYWFRK